MTGQFFATLYGVPDWILVDNVLLLDGLDCVIIRPLEFGTACTLLQPNIRPDPVEEE